MRRRPRILLDVDGPLTSGFVDQSCFLLRELGVAGACPEALKTWDVSTLAPTQEIKDRLLAWARSPGTALGFKLRSGAREFVDWLREWAHVIAVTAPFDSSPTWSHDREIWLERELGFFHREVISARMKSPIAADALIDDKLEHIYEWHAEWCGIAVLWETPHNGADNWVTRAGNFEAARAILETLRR